MISNDESGTAHATDLHAAPTEQSRAGRALIVTKSLLELLDSQYWPSLNQDQRRETRKWNLLALIAPAVRRIQYDSEPQAEQPKHDADN